MESNKRSILATATLDFASLAANTTAELTVPVNGAKVGQPVIVSGAALVTGLVGSGTVETAGVVTVRIANVTTGAIDPASQEIQLALI